MKILLALLVGCNSVFGNNTVQRIDAQYFDAPIDGPSQCPPVGQTPQFSTVLHQQILQHCLAYRFNHGRAVAMCQAPDGNLGVFEGPIDQPMQLVPELDSTNVSVAYDEVMLSSDAQTMFLRQVDFSTGFVNTQSARRQPDGTWQLGAPPAFGQNPSDSLVGIAHGPTGDHALIGAGDHTIHEWGDDAGTWRELQVHASSVYDAQVSADGLRLTIYSSTQTYLYSDRPDEDAPFREPVPLAGAPHAGMAAALTEDCSRLYVTGLSSVFYVQQ